MNVKSLTMAMLVDRLKNGQRFALVRYGDGEFACMRDEKGQNCDGVHYSPDMAQALDRALINGRLLHCLESIAVHNGFGEWIDDYYPEAEWYEADEIHNAVQDGEAWPLKVAIYNQPSVYVGPGRLQYFAQDALGCRGFVPVPLTTAFDELARIEDGTRAAIAYHDAQIVGVSAGPAAKILIDRLEADYPAVTFWDFGSEWDMFAGFPTRSGSKRLTIEQIRHLSWRNFHWQPAAMRRMAWPSIHDLMTIPGLMTEDEATFLYDTALKAPRGQWVELGTYRGRSAAMLARAARDAGAHVMSIDTYVYRAHEGSRDEPAQNLGRFRLQVDFHSGDSLIVPPGLNAISLLHVDSNHTAEHVRAELDAWLPLLVQGGVVLFHDYGATYPGVTIVVDERMRDGWMKLGQVRRMIAFRKDKP